VEELAAYSLCVGDTREPDQPDGSATGLERLIAMIYWPLIRVELECLNVRDGVLYVLGRFGDGIHLVQQDQEASASQDSRSMHIEWLSASVCDALRSASRKRSIIGIDMQAPSVAFVQERIAISSW
jgi:hypothetical protein